MYLVGRQVLEQTVEVLTIDLLLRLEQGMRVKRDFSVSHLGPGLVLGRERGKETKAFEK